MKHKTKNNGSSISQVTAGQVDYTAAQQRVGKGAKLIRGISRGDVIVEAYRQVYGRMEYLVRNERGEREWVKEASLEWLPTVAATGQAIDQAQIDEAGV